VADLREQLQRGLADRYGIERELGRGGMATVYLARDLKHDRPVALKVLHAELGRVLGGDRFQREIRLAARLQHPHILTVLDSGEAVDPAGGTAQLWFTMPLVDGETLRTRLQREHQLPVDDALRIAREAAQALQYAHDQGVIHRDVKPENLLLTRDGNTLVADFGIARALTGGQAGGRAGGQVGADERLTETGLTLGTPAYMSPEQAGGARELDPRSDIYSLGTVLYEMLAGEPPFSGTTPQALLARRVLEDAPPLRQRRPSAPEWLERAVAKALARMPADRFASAAELGRALQAGQTTAAAAPTTATSLTAAREAAPRGRHRVPTLALTLGLGVLIGLGVLFAWRRGHTDGEPAGERRLAVLPFENLGDSTTEYFAAGVTDAVRGKLAAIPGLQVIASRSSDEYKHSAKALPEIAGELGAEYLLIARIRWAKAADGTSRVEVSPELVEVGPDRTPTTKWQQPFEAAMTDVFRVQADIAGQVASALDLALGAGQKQALAERPTQNLAAYDAFLKGEASGGLLLFSPLPLRNAITYYEQAVALDSGFALAWAQLSRSHSAYYFNVTPSPTEREAARRAAERASALSPGHPAAQQALGDYYQAVINDYRQALAMYEAGLAAAPENTDLLTAAALTEQSLGRWDAAVTHLERAQTLDPRSVSTLRRLSGSLLRLRRYPEALAAADRGVALSPTNLDLLQNKVMVKLAQGDTSGARSVLRSASPELEPTALVAHFGNYWDLYWTLDDGQQRLLLRLPPSVYDGDRGAWGLVLAQTYALRGDQARARAYADSARVGIEETLRVSPNDPQRRVFLGLALAYLGRKAEAMKEGERGAALAPSSRDGYIGPYLQHQLARIYILVNEPDKAIDQLEQLLGMPYYLSPGWLRVDPNFAPLRNHPRFQRLLSRTP
jgi:eukaryotic-like serine/threonine-protein kinase